MKNLIFCIKLKRKEIKLNKPPFDNLLGEFIYKNISKKIWNKWVKIQIMLINENNLVLAKNNDRNLIINQMKFYLFK